MTGWLIYDGHTIVNAIVAESQEIAESVTGLSAMQASADGVPWIGWTLVDDKWVAPSSPEPTTE
jgi:hypothetical protein